LRLFTRHFIIFDKEPASRDGVAENVKIHPLGFLGQSAAAKVDPEGKSFSCNLRHCTGADCKLNDQKVFYRMVGGVTIDVSCLSVPLRWTATDS